MNYPLQTRKEVLKILVCLVTGNNFFSVLFETKGTRAQKLMWICVRLKKVQRPEFGRVAKKQSYPNA